MHEAALRAGIVHEHLGDTIGSQFLDTLFPDTVGLAHRDPNIGVDHMGTLGCFHGIGDKLQNCAGLGGDCLTLLHQFLVGEVLGRGAGNEVHAQLGTANHERIAHVEPGVTHVNQLLAGKIAEMLTDGQEICQDLGGMELIGEAVPNGNACVFCQIFHDGLGKTAVFNTIVHTAQDSCSVRNGFLFAHLAAAGS